MKSEKKLKDKSNEDRRMHTSPIQALIVVPAFNAAQGLAQILPILPSSHTIVIDDGSIDESAKVAHHFGHKVITHKQNLGLSAAISTGKKYAIRNGYTHMLLIDADGQHPPQLYQEFLIKMATNDFVLGDRFSSMCCVPTQKIASNLFASLMIKKTTGVFIRDVACGYRGYTIDENKIENYSIGFSFIYDQIIDLALKGVSPARVLVPPLYNILEPLSTKYSELRDLSYSLTKYFPDCELVAKLHDTMEKKVNINIRIENVPFVAHYVREWNSYIFATDVSLARKYYGN